MIIKKEDGSLVEIKDRTTAYAMQFHDNHSDETHFILLGFGFQTPTEAKQKAINFLERYFSEYRELYKNQDFENEHLNFFVFSKKVLLRQELFVKNGLNFDSYVKVCDIKCKEMWKK